MNALPFILLLFSSFFFLRSFVSTIAQLVTKLCSAKVNDLCCFKEDKFCEVLNPLIPFQRLKPEKQIVLVALNVTNTSEINQIPEF